jgi:hypothetical protein
LETDVRVCVCAQMYAWVCVCECVCVCVSETALVETSPDDDKKNQVNKNLSVSETALVEPSPASKSQITFSRFFRRITSRCTTTASCSCTATSTRTCTKSWCTARRGLRPRGSIGTKNCNVMYDVPLYHVASWCTVVHLRPIKSCTTLRRGVRLDYMFRYRADYAVMHDVPLHVAVYP